MHIRPLQQGEQHAVEQLMAQHPLQFPSFVIRRYPARWEAFLSSQSSASCYYVAVADGTIAGHAGYIYNKEIGMYEIVGVAISTQQHRRGYGTRLLQAICEQLASLGEKQVMLYTLDHPGNAGTLEFYRRIGFELVNHEPDFFKSGLHRITFQKTFSPNKKPSGTTSSP